MQRHRVRANQSRGDPGLSLEDISGQQYRLESHRERETHPRPGPSQGPPTLAPGGPMEPLLAPEWRDRYLKLEEENNAAKESRFLVFRI